MVINGLLANGKTGLVQWHFSKPGRVKTKTRAPQRVIVSLSPAEVSIDPINKTSLWATV